MRKPESVLIAESAAVLVDDLPDERLFVCDDAAAADVEILERHRHHVAHVKCAKSSGVRITRSRLSDAREIAVDVRRGSVVRGVRTASSEGEPRLSLSAATRCWRGPSGGRDKDASSPHRRERQGGGPLPTC